MTLVGAGDIARCDSRADRATAKLLRRISGTVFTLGDNAYPDGTAAQFRDCYGPTWGKYKKRTKPAVGNHEYHIRGARPYFDYFGARAGKPGRGYYSYDRGSLAHRRPQQQLRGGGLPRPFSPGALAQQGPRQAPIEVHVGLFPPPAHCLR